MSRSGSVNELLEHAPLRVLVAEDDRDMRNLLVECLRRHRCEVVEAAHGTQCLELIHHGVLGTEAEPRVDVIISDIRMPGVSGLEVLSRVRGSGLSVPVIMITGFGDAETHAEAGRLGALAVFNKPFDLDDLCAVVAALPRRQQMGREPRA